VRGPGGFVLPAASIRTAYRQSRELLPGRLQRFRQTRDFRIAGLGCSMTCRHLIEHQGARTDQRIERLPAWPLAAARLSSVSMLDASNLALAAA